MEEDDAAGRRLAVAVQSQGRSLASEVRSHMPGFRDHLAAGYTHDQIVTALAAVGVKISRGTLRKYLYREARSAGSGLDVAPPGPLQSTSKVSPNAPEVASVAPPPPPPQAAVSPMSFEDAMDPRKRAELADQFLKPKPLIRRAKIQSEN